MSEKPRKPAADQSMQQLVDELELQEPIQEMRQAIYRIRVFFEENPEDAQRCRQILNNPKHQHLRIHIHGDPQIIDALKAADHNVVGSSSRFSANTNFTIIRAALRLAKKPEVKKQ